MPYQGENFPGQLNRQRGLKGFYTVRVVEAENEVDAELAAMDLLRKDPALQVKSKKLQEQEPPAKVYFVRIDQLRDGEEQPGTGLIWFTMK